MPVFLNPKDGSPMPTSALTFTNSSAYFYDANSNGVFDLDTERAFINNDNDPTSFAPAIDQPLFLGTNVGVNPAIALDYTSITLTIDGVDY
jgi:hypothetical protein